MHSHERLLVFIVIVYSIAEIIHLQHGLSFFFISFIH